MHTSQQDFCRRVRELYPQFFAEVTVVDFGSLDINGTNRFLFDNCKYTGVDLGLGKGVDAISRAHEFKPPNPVDTVISTEMLEHDQYWELSLANMVDILKPGGLLVLSCATTGRGEHGTWGTSPTDSPFTSDYYRNLTKEDVAGALDVDRNFSAYVFELNAAPADLYFWGVKRELGLPDV
jgi:SAM-dependent methyltransferase